MVDPTRPSDSGRVRNEDPQPQEQQPQKTTPSAFDEVLRAKSMTQTPQQQQSTQQGSTTLQQGEARERAQDRRSQSDSEHKESRDERSSGEGESRHSEGPTEGRVEAKGQSREREGGGGQGQSQFGGGRGGAARETSQAKFKESAKSTVHGQTQSAFAAQLKKADAQNALSPKHMQQIVNKVVQYFRIKKMTTGETEVELGFQDEIFKGLRLRLIQKDGKVLLHIQSGEGDVRRLFEKNRDAIQKALSDKGVQISSIVIAAE